MLTSVPAPCAIAADATFNHRDMVDKNDLAAEIGQIGQADWQYCICAQLEGGPGSSDQTSALALAAGTSARVLSRGCVQDVCHAEQEQAATVLSAQRATSTTMFHLSVFST